MRPVMALSCLLLLAGCDSRAVNIDDSGDGESDRHAVASDGGGTVRQCTLPPGVHGAGTAFNLAPDISSTTAKVTTDLSTIQVTVPAGKEAFVTVRLRRDGSLPVLPRMLDLSVPEPSDPWDSWEFEVEYAWCNPMECRVEFRASSLEPSHRLSGWVTFDGTLFSDLSRATTCVTAEEGGKQLTVAVTGER